MEIREQQLSRAQHLALNRLWLLDLHNHVSLGEHVGSFGGDVCSRAHVIIVIHANAGASARLHQYLVAVRGQLADAGRRRPTRYSRTLISLGTPTSIALSPSRFGATIIMQVKDN